MDPETLSIVLGTWGYPALLLLLVLTGVGSPVPEDLLLLTAGYLVSSEVLRWPLTSAICLVGVIMSDLALYSAGRHLAWHASRWPDGHLLSRERLDRVTGWFDRVGDPLIFIARLVPGTRALVFLAAGVRAVPPSRFLRYDVPGALLWVPAMLIVGHRAGDRIGGLEPALAWLQQSAPWLISIVMVLLLSWLAWGREGSKL